MRMFALEAVDLDALRTDIMARMEHHRDRQARFERILAKRFPDGTAPAADLGKLLNLRLGVRHERAVVEWCEEALEALSTGQAGPGIMPARKTMASTNRAAAWAIRTKTKKVQNSWRDARPLKSAYLRSVAMTD